MDLHEQLKDIKTQFRLAMNGAVSQSMREKGLIYKLNFGVELPRIKQIAARYEPNHELAQALWKEDIRECKILATLLQPVETFLPEIADIWVESIRNIEMAELASMNLFCRLPYASQKAYEWIARDEDMFQVCGYLILSRLFMQGMQPNPRAADEFLDQARTALHSAPAVRRATVAALQKYQALDDEACREVETILEEEAL